METFNREPPSTGFPLEVKGHHHALADSFVSNEIAFGRSGYIYTAARDYGDFFASHKRWLLLLLVASIGIEYRPSIGGMPLKLSLAEVTAFCVSLIVLADVVIWRESWWRELFAKDSTKSLFTVWLVWLFALGPTMLLRGDRYGLERLRDLFPGLLCFLLVSSFVRSKTDLRRVIGVWLSTTYLNVAIGYSQYFLGRPYPSEIGITAMQKLDLAGGRYAGNLVIGFFTHPNGLGMVLIGPALYLLWRLLHPSKFVSYLLNLAGFILVVACLYLTQTRGAIYWALAGFAALVIARLVSRNQTLLISVLVVELVVLLLLANIDFLGSPGTIRGRFTQWQAALSVLAQNPDVLLLGGGAYPIARESLLASHLSYAYPNAHNSLLNLILFFGLPSLILFVLVAGRIIASFGRAVPKGDCPWAVPFLVISICVLFESLFEPFWEGNVPGGQFFLILAMLNAIRSRGSMWQI